MLIANNKPPLLYFAALSGFMILLVTYLYDTFWKVQFT